MSTDNTHDCIKCGAVVKNNASHKTWHEALEKLMPGLEAERERITEQRRREHSSKLHGI